MDPIEKQPAADDAAPTTYAVDDAYAAPTDADGGEPEGDVLTLDDAPLTDADLTAATDDPFDDDREYVADDGESDVDLNAPPPPATPDTPTDAAQRRVAYERQINDDWQTFIGQVNQEVFVNHRLAGREVRLVAYEVDDDGEHIYEPEPEPAPIPYPDADVTVSHDDVVAADPDSTDLRSETDNPMTR